MTTLEYTIIGFNLGLVFIACGAAILACWRKPQDDVELKIKTIEGHIATLQRVIAVLIDLREDVQLTQKLEQTIAEAVAKPKTGLAPTPVTLTPPNAPRKAARANPANVKGGRK